MGSHKFSFIIPFISLFLFFSCNQNVPQLLSTEISIIFEYSDKTSLPEIRLSVYLETETDPRLLESMFVNSLETKYSWVTDDLIKIKENPKNFAGYSNFKVPSGEIIPKGAYSIEITGYNGETSKVNYNLQYNEEIYTKKSTELPLFLNGEITKKMAIYDKQEMLVYYGDKTEDMSNPVEIRNAYSEAKKYREVWILGEGTQMILFPEEDVIQAS